MIVSKGLESRTALTERLQKRLREDFVGIGSYVQALEMGPPVGRPIQYRGPVALFRSDLTARISTRPRLG